MQRSRCQYTPTQYITLYRLPWLITRARIHLLQWLVVWIKSWFSFYHELNKLSLYNIYINISDSMFIFYVSPCYCIGIYIVKDPFIKLFKTTTSVHQFQIKMRCPKFQLITAYKMFRDSSYFSCDVILILFKSCRII